MPFMKAPYPSTINSLTGHCLVADANDVLWVPPEVENEAVAKGWQHTDEKPPVEAPEQLSDNVTEEQSDEVDEFQVELDQAVLRVLTRNDESDFKSDGMPKVNAIVAEMSPDLKRPTATQIADTYERMQENINLAG